MSAFIQSLYDQGVFHLPGVLSALLILIIGWVAARLLRSAAQRLTIFGLNSLKRFRDFPFTRESGAAYQFLPKITGILVFWTTLFLAITAATELLGLEVFSRLFSSAAGYFPKVFLAIAIVFAGILASDAAYTWVYRLGVQAQLAFVNILARSSQAAIILLAGMVAIDYLGISNSVILVVLGISASSIFGACALAFGLGARVVVGNIISAQYLQKVYRIGHVVRIGNLQGTVASISRTAVILDTREGHMHVPARRFMEEPSLLLSPSEDV